MNVKKQILVLNTARKALLDAINVIENEEEHDKKYKELEPKIDIYEKDITDLMKQNFDDLEFDFMLEQLSFLGQCPCLLNDDHGHWTVTCEGFSSISTEITDWNGAFIVEKKYWKDTPREALKYLLIEDEDIDEEDTSSHTVCYDPPT
jgi:hypothetical protein